MNRFWTSPIPFLSLSLLLLMLFCGACTQPSPLTGSAPMDEPAPAAETLPATAEPTPTAEATQPPATETVAVAATAEPAEEEMPPTPEVTASSAPVAVSQGAFGEGNGSYRGSGMAAIYRLPDGQRELRFESFNVSSGPDLYVYLSGHAAPRSSDQLHAEGALEVALLKSITGDQAYTLPADLDVSAYRSAVIYCKQFSVIFSTAELVTP